MRRIISVITALFMILVAFSSVSIIGADDYESGDGSSSNPYQITHIEHLNNVRNDLSKDFVLMNNLDFESDDSYLNSSHKSDYISGDGWLPFDDFSGSFDGKGHVISNLFINRSDSNNVGLFSEIPGATNTVIRNLHLRDINVTGYYYTGGIIGSISSGTIENCSTTGSVEGYKQIGGLSGHISGSGITIKNCYSTCNVTSSSNFAGGFAGGLVNSPTITKCYSTGDVSGNDDTGGFAGSVTGVVVDCYSTGDVEGDTNVGGFAGSFMTHNTGYIKNVYATGNVTGNSYRGGLLGELNDVDFKPFCFFADSKITLSDGTLVSADEISVGDVVLTYNDGFGVGEVIDIQIWNNVDTEVIKINDMEISPDHPVRTRNGWKSAGLVELGDEIFNSDGVFEIVDSVDVWQEFRTYYDFQIDDNHAFFADGFLVSGPRASVYTGNMDVENFEGLLYGIYEEEDNHDSKLLDLMDSKDKKDYMYFDVEPSYRYIIQGYKSDECYFDYIGFVADGEEIVYRDDKISIENENKIIINQDLSDAEDVTLVVKGWFDPYNGATDSEYTLLPFGNPDSGLHYSFWNSDEITDGIGNHKGGTYANISGLSVTELKNMTHYEDYLWDISEKTGYVSDIWEIENGTDFPRLWWEYLPGTATSISTEVDHNSAVLNGYLRTDGGEACDGWFEYGEDISYGSTTSRGSVSGEFSDSISGLSPGTTYHYRSVANNTAGESYGSDMTFTTGYHVYVDDNADPSWYDATHVKTIQEGINNATVGDSIYIYNGTYSENVTVDKQVTISGESKDGVIFNFPSGDWEADAVFEITADGVSVSGITFKISQDLYQYVKILANQTTIDNCKFDGQSASPSKFVQFGIEGGSSSFNNNILTNSGFWNGGYQGIGIWNTYDSVISDSYIEDTGIRIEDDSTGNLIHGNTIDKGNSNNCPIFITLGQDNIISNNDISITGDVNQAVWISNGDGTQILNNSLSYSGMQSSEGVQIDGGNDDVLIQNNTFEGFTDCAVYSTSGAISNLSVIGNHFHNIWWGSIQILYQTSTVYSRDIIIEDNTHSHNESTLAENEDYGLYLNNIINLEVRNNSLGYNSESGDMIGWIHQSENVLVTENTMFDSDWGLYIDECEDVTFSHNTIDNLTKPCQFDTSVNPPNIHNNTFTDSGLALYGNFDATVNDNTVNGRTLRYYNGQTSLSLDGNSLSTGQLILANCDNSSVTNMNISDTVGMGIYDCEDISIDSSEMRNDRYGVMIYDSNNIEVENSTFSGNYEDFEIDNSDNNLLHHLDSTDTTIPLYTSSDSDSNDYYNNTVNNSLYFIYLDGTSSEIYYNNVYNSQVQNGGFGSNNIVHRNNFYNTTFSACSNEWLGGNPKVGNYYDDYSGVDSNSDGLGDSAYSNDDYRPLFNAYPSSKPSVTAPFYNENTGEYDTELQTAIDESTAGDTININWQDYLSQGGSFGEENLVINKEISIIGSDRDNVVLNGGGSTTIEVNSNNVVLENLTITGAQVITDVDATDYCSHGSTDNYFYITNVQLGDLDATTGQDGGYLDNTANTATLTPGETYDLNVTVSSSIGGYPLYAKAFIDWNSDGTLESEYELGNAETSGTTFSSTVTVPSDFGGATLMRVFVKYNGYPSTPCSSLTYGEVEDYEIFSTPADYPSGVIVNAENVEITHCNITNNYYSIKCEGSGVKAYYNNFIGNTDYVDAGDSIYRYNYWDDYDSAGEGAYDNDSNNVVDDDYNVPGGDNKDRALITPSEITTSYPIVHLNSTTGLTGTSVVLNGYLEDDAGQPREVWFEYGPTTEYGTTTTVQSSKTSGDSFSQEITGLDPATNYYYRAIANGSEYGSTYDTFDTGNVLLDVRNTEDNSNYIDVKKGNQLNLSTYVNTNEVWIDTVSTYELTFTQSLLDGVDANSDNTANVTFGDLFDSTTFQLGGTINNTAGTLSEIVWGNGDTNVSGTMYYMLFDTSEGTGYAYVNLTYDEIGVAKDMNDIPYSIASNATIYIHYYVPTNPSPFTATTLSQSEIDLSWTKDLTTTGPDDGVGEYTIIERNTVETWSRGDGTEIYNDTGTSFTDSGLSQQVTYYYQAWSYNVTDNLYSPLFASANDTTSTLQPPSSFDVFATDSSYGYKELDLSWVKADQANTTYVERNTVSTWSRGDGTMVYNDTGTSFIDTDLDTHTTYYYQAWSYNISLDDAVSAWSNSYSEDFDTTLNNAPEQPINPTPSDNAPYESVYDCVLNATVYDLDLPDETFTVEFWFESSLVRTATSVGNNTVTSYDLTQYLDPDWLDHDTTYTWYITVNDSVDVTTGPTWSFDTSHYTDTNEDGSIDYLDVSFLSGHYRESCDPGQYGWDIIENGQSDYLDVSALVSDYGETFP